MARLREGDLDLERWDWQPSDTDLSEKLRKRTPLFFSPSERVRLWAERERESRLREHLRRLNAGLGPAPNPVNWFLLEEVDPMGTSLTFI